MTRPIHAVRLMGLPLIVALAVELPGIGGQESQSGTDVPERAAPAPVDFGREILPLLSDRCFACHGPDAGTVEGGLRLDTREGAARDLGGYAAVVPGDAAASELIARVGSEFDFEVMPPPDAHKPRLSVAELETLSRWIDEGAVWGHHWAFVVPEKAQVSGGATHPVDELVLRRLRPLGLGLSAQADPMVLARRLSLGLTGRPPDMEDWEAAVEGQGPEALDRWMDELLHSPEHAERLAMWWLDAARYADTDGFQSDGRRTNWPWRDWVVRSFTENMPFDRFTELQFAGDLVAEASDETILATCFHRNHMHNGEGGRDPEESRVDYVRDRTNTVGAVWLGLTLECAQCHDHKFDPLSQADYYSLSAFFDSIDESGRAGSGAGPFLEYTPGGLAEHTLAAARELARAEAELADLEESLGPRWERWLKARSEELTPAHSSWTALPVQSVVAASGEALLAEGPGQILRSGGASNQDEYVTVFDASGIEQVTGVEVEVLRAGEAGALGGGPSGEFVLTGIYLRALSVDSQVEAEITGAVATVEASQDGRAYGRVAGALDDDPRSGWSTEGREVEGSAVARFALSRALQLSPGDRLQLEVHFRSEVQGAYVQRMRVRFTGEPGPAARRLGATPFETLGNAGGFDAVEPGLREDLRAAFLEQDEGWASLNLRVTRFGAQALEMTKAQGIQKVTVLRERDSPRQTYVLERGEWDKHGAGVEPGFPSRLFVQPIPHSEGARATRLDLARWITHPRNPLTARVITNQVWQMLFGRGLVSTPADFGLQGAAPLNQELLDWLAVDFVESGWDLRHLVRTIVTSRTYRQSSKVTAAEYAADPDNENLARGPRFRMPSWMIRDHALACADILDPTMGGPPVYPHQPVGVWEELFMGRFTYPSTVGRGGYRRSLYAFWRRNSAPTFFFDQADRRTCAVNRRETNTPLQALTLLNDRTYQDAALALARTACLEQPGDAGKRIRLMGKRVLCRSLTAVETKALMGLYAQVLGEFRADQSKAVAVAAVAHMGPQRGELAEILPDVAAMASVAAVLFNTDEAMTIE